MMQVSPDVVPVWVARACIALWGSAPHARVSSKLQMQMRPAQLHLGLILVLSLCCFLDLECPREGSVALLCMVCLMCFSRQG